MLTGVGAVVNTARVPPGAVVGLGGVGLNAVLGALLVGAREVVDLNQDKLKLADRLGATATFDAGDATALAELHAHTGGGVDYAFEMAGSGHQPLAFPEVIDAGLRVGKLGASSVRYEIGLFRQGHDEPAATGQFVHVFVGRRTRQSTAMPPGIRACLERLVVS